MISQHQFIELVQQNEGILFKISSLYTDGKADQEDLRQEMLLQLWKSIGRYRREATFSTWMYRVALNVALNFRRSLKKERVESMEDMSKLKLLIDQKKDYEVLHYIIRMMPEGEKTIMMMHLDGYTNVEIAEVIGITSNSLNVKIHRIKQSISESYKKISDGY